METISFFPALLKMIAALALVLGIMIGLAFLVRRFFQQTGIAAPDGSAISVLTVKHLGPKTSIMILDILGQAVVVGMSNQQMSYITTLDDPVSLEKLQSLSRQRGGQTMPIDPLNHYKNLIKTMIGSKKGRNRS
ncbi:MAG: flagellar biosynthetic protein FliO [Syntrophaceae bacterium]|nr:flagellar biosynthetic protein FliO [Syntrophaceae bacterium]